MAGTTTKVRRRPPCIDCVPCLCSTHPQPFQPPFQIHTPEQQTTKKTTGTKGKGAKKGTATGFSLYIKERCVVRFGWGSSISIYIPS